MDGLLSFLLDGLGLFLFLRLSGFVFLLGLLVLPTVLVGLPVAHGSRIGHVPLDFLLTFPFTHVTVDGLEAGVLAEVNTDSYLGISYLQLYRLTFANGLTLVLAKGDVLHMLQLVHALFQFYRLDVSFQQTLGFLVKL